MNTKSTSGQNGCIAPKSFYNTDCSLPGDFYYGCFYPNPCISAMSAAAAESTSGEHCFLFREHQAVRVLYWEKVSPKYVKRAPLPACPSGYTYYDTTCGDSGYVKGCLNEEPCEQLDNNDALSVVPTIGAPQLTTISLPATTTSTLTIILTNSARTRTAILTISTSSSNSRSNSNTPLSGSQTAATTSTSSTLAQAATSVAAIASAPVTLSSTLAQSTNPVAAVSSSSAESSPSPSPSHGDTTAVAAGTAGAVVGAMIALILMLRVLKWRKRRTEKDIRTTEQDTEEQMQDASANRAEEPFHSEENGGKSRDLAHVTPFTTKLSQQGTSKRYFRNYVTISLSLTRYQALLVVSPAVTCIGPCR